MNQSIRWKSLVAGCALILGTSTALLGCGDDENGANGTNGSGGNSTMTISGDVGAHYDGPGGNLYNFSFEGDFADGHLNSDGTFSFELLDLTDIEDDLEKPAESVLDGFSSFVCIEEFIDEFDDDARFAAVKNVGYLETRADESGYARHIELTTLTEGEARSIVSPFPDREEIYVFWYYSTTSVSAEATCSSGEINIDLSPGWNEIILDNTDRDDRRQYTGERPDGVDWYMEPAEEE